MIRIPLSQMALLVGYRAANLKGHIVANTSRSTLVSHQHSRTIVR